MNDTSLHPFELLRLAVLWYAPELNEHIEQQRIEWQKNIDNMITTELTILSKADPDFIQIIEE